MMWAAIRSNEFLIGVGLLIAAFVGDWMRRRKEEKSAKC